MNSTQLNSEFDYKVWRKGIDRYVKVGGIIKSLRLDSRYARVHIFLVFVNCKDKGQDKFIGWSACSTGYLAPSNEPTMHDWIAPNPLVYVPSAVLAQSLSPVLVNCPYHPNLNAASNGS
jgi:hypothetical protein